MIEETLFGILANDPAINAIIAARVYPNIMPQKEAVPAITYQQISGELDYDADAQDLLKHPLFEITCWAGSYMQAKQIAMAVIAKLSGYKSDEQNIQAIFLKDEKDIYEKKDGNDLIARHGRKLIFEIWHNQV